MVAIRNVRGTDVGEVLGRLVVWAGSPALTAFGLYLALQAAFEDEVRPAAIALGAVGILATNGVAVWLAGRTMAVGAGGPDLALVVAAPATRVMTSPRPTGTVAFLFTDIEGSTAMWEREPAHMRIALRRHDEILHDAVEERSGVVFSRAGDGVGVAFARPHDAVGTGLAVQRMLAQTNWPAGLELRVRIGVNLGRADERDGDYFGPPVNRAARVMALAAPGTVLVTSLIAEAARTMPGVEFRDHGAHRLRGVDGVTRLFAARTSRGRGSEAGSNVRLLEVDHLGHHGGGRQLSAGCSEPGRDHLGTACRELGLGERGQALPSSLHERLVDGGVGTGQDDRLG